MKRVVTVSVALIYLSAATAFAQEPIGRHVRATQAVTFAPPAPTPSVSLVPKIPQVKVTAMAAPAPRLWTAVQPAKLSAAAALAKNPSSSKSFWKSPWPYLITGGVVVAVVVARHGGYKSNTPGCSDPSCSVY